MNDCYLVLRDPSGHRLGEKIDAPSFDLGLKDGHMIPGMLVQHIENGKAKGLFVIRGRELSLQWLEATG